METIWGLLGPATLMGERRSRSLGIRRAIRRFNDLAVPGIGGLWFGKQLLLAVLGIRVAELARAQGLAVGNLECANAVEALACWLAFSQGNWVQDARLRGRNKLPRVHPLDFQSFRRAGFYVTQPMRMGVGQALQPLGFAQAGSHRFNALRSTSACDALIEAACGTLRPFKRGVVQHLLLWARGEESRLHTPPLVAALAPCAAMPEIARTFVHDRLLLGAGDQDAWSGARRRAALQWCETLRTQPPTGPLNWARRPAALADDAHWTDLQAGASFLLARDAAIALLEALELRVAIAPRETLAVTAAARLLADEIARLRDAAGAFLETGHADAEGVGFCRECRDGTQAEVLSRIVARDARVLRLVGGDVRSGPAFSRSIPDTRAMDVDERTALSVEPEDGGVNAGGFAWPEGISYRVRNLYLLNLDLHDKLDATLRQRGAEEAA